MLLRDEAVEFYCVLIIKSTCNYVTVMIKYHLLICGIVMPINICDYRRSAGARTDCPIYSVKNAVGRKEED